MCAQQLGTDEGSYVEEEEDEEEEETSESNYFGHEYGRSYNGERMDNDGLSPSESSRDNLICPIDYILDHRYQIKSMIGHGTFCLVWLAYDHVLQRDVAIKVLKKTEDEVFDDEYIVNQYLSEDMTEDAKVVKFYRTFYHLEHPCLVFELVAHNILTFIEYLSGSCVTLPLRLVKKIVNDTLLGLDYMHKRGVIHTDLKLENVMSSRALFPNKPFDADDDDIDVFHCLEDDPNSVDFKLGDLGNACFVNCPMNDLIQTRQYRSPEVLLGLPYDTSADIWSLGCMTFELVTKNYLFDPAPTDDSGSASSREGDGRDAIHLSMIEQVIGSIPQDWAREGKLYDLLYENGQLLEQNDPPLPGIYKLLLKSDVPEDEAHALTEFITPMLAIVPAQRPSAEELLQSPWFHDL